MFQRSHLPIRTALTAATVVVGTSLAIGIAGGTAGASAPADERLHHVQRS